MPTKKPSKAEQHTEALANLGESVLQVVRALPRSGIAPSKEAGAIGTMLYNAMKAGLKADLAGRQLDHQIKPNMTAHLYGFNRYLARKVAHLL